MEAVSRPTRVIAAAASLAAAVGAFQSFAGETAVPVKPRVITETVVHDTDDPAIWIDRAAPERSLILGTDKDTQGGLYAFDLHGKIVRKVEALARPNNVDIACDVDLGGRKGDVAVVTERQRQRLRVFAMPELTPLDRGDLAVFEGDAARAPMGVALYRRPTDGTLFVFVGGKSGPTEGYLAQYRFETSADGSIRLQPVRQFGRYSGRKEIEAIAVDDELGFVYYSDETFGVRKYAADPDAADGSRELALFGTSGFTGDHEGISIYRTGPGTGYLIVSDQQANRMRLFKREGESGRPHEHTFVKSVPILAVESDGNDVTSHALGPRFPRGLLAVMSNGRVFHYYAWEDIIGHDGPP